MAHLFLLPGADEEAGNIRICQWCNGPIKANDRLRLGVGLSGTKYLVCPTCVADAEREKAGKETGG